MILIFEGMDKVGKTTLIQHVDKTFKYRDLVIVDRGPDGYITYDKIYGRCNIGEHHKDEMDLYKTNCLVIYCFADEKDIQKRLDEHNETLEQSISDTLVKYMKAVRDSKLEVLFVNTSQNSIQQSLEKIKEKVDEIYNNSRFIKLKVKLENKNYIEYYPSFNVFDRYLLEQLPSFDKSIDPTYYTMLEAELNQMLHKHEIGWLNGRQLIYTSNDCISFFQLVGCKNHFEIIINQRSLDLEKHTTNDLMFFYDWYKKHFNSDVIIHYNIGVPHRYLKGE